MKTEIILELNQVSAINGNKYYRVIFICKLESKKFHKFPQREDLQINS